MIKATGNAGKRGGSATAMLIATAVGALALPSAVLALSSGFDPLPDDGADSARDGFIPAQVDPRLSRSITVRALSKGRLFQFTPAASPTRPDRSLTVAVRVDPAVARSLVEARSLALRDDAAVLRIAPTAYSLGAARGYKSFASSGSGFADPRKSDIPDLASFRPSPGVRSDPSRFAPRVALDEREKTGRLPRTFEGQGEQSVEVGGSYRVTGNLNVTAGLRYQSERDRLVPVSDARQDSQAVYVGTQFKF